MPQVYTVKEWKVWQDDNHEPVTDNYGNFMGSITFDEHNTEPVDARFKNEPKVGDKLEGEIKPYKTKSGSDRTRFERAKPAFTGGGGGRAPSDPRTMYTAYAKDVWVAMSADGQVDSEAYLQALDQIKSGGERLMNGE